MLGALTSSDSSAKVTIVADAGDERDVQLDSLSGLFNAVRMAAMKTADRLTYFFALFFLAIFASSVAYAQSDAERIRALEERVAQLERIVDSLAQARGEAQDDAARRLTASVAALETTDPPLPPHLCLPPRNRAEHCRRSCCQTWERLARPLSSMQASIAVLFPLDAEVSSAVDSAFPSRWYPEDACSMK